MRAHEQWIDRARSLQKALRLIFNTSGPQVPANKEVPRMRVRRGTRRGGWGEGKDIG